MPTEMSDADFETAYELIAQALDQVPESEDKLFLTKLALFLARRTGNLEGLREAIAAARRNL